MIDRASKMLFVGPLCYEKNSPKCHFHILQPGGPPIRLDYPNTIVAVDARNGLLGNSHAYAVTTMKLFNAVYEGFNDVDMLATQKHGGTSHASVASMPGDITEETTDTPSGETPHTPSDDRRTP